MRRLLLSILVYALTFSDATALNKVSQELLWLDENERNETLTDVLRDGNAKCDRVIRSVVSGATADLDAWEVLCRNRNSYALAMPSEPGAAVDFISCRQLLATSKKLLQTAGSKAAPTGCRIKRSERPRRRVTGLHSRLIETLPTLAAR